MKTQLGGVQNGLVRVAYQPVMLGTVLEEPQNPTRSDVPMQMRKMPAERKFIGTG